jgi:hypothetical protein
MAHILDGGKLEVNYGKAEGLRRCYETVRE